jgi:hypothetical protein
MKQVMIIGICLFSIAAKAQFINPTEFQVMAVKELTVTDTAGKVFTGELHRVKEKKQLVTEFVLKTKEGEKIEFTPEGVKMIYCKNTAVARLGALNSGTLNRLDKQGYSKKKDTLVYESVKDADGKIMLLQVINPCCDSKIKVYGNPSAGKTTSWTGFDGGLDRSYYVSKKGQPAFKLIKKEMREKFEMLFGDCPELKEKMTSMSWEAFDTYIEKYESCQ